MVLLSPRQILYTTLVRWTSLMSCFMWANLERYHMGIRKDCWAWCAREAASERSKWYSLHWCGIMAEVPHELSWSWRIPQEQVRELDCILRFASRLEKPQSTVGSSDWMLNFMSEFQTGIQTLAKLHSIKIAEVQASRLNYILILSSILSKNWASVIIVVFLV